VSRWTQEASGGIRLFSSSPVVRAVLLPRFASHLGSVSWGKVGTCIYVVCWVNFSRKRAVTRGKRGKFPWWCLFLAEFWPVYASQESFQNQHLRGQEPFVHLSLCSTVPCFRLQAVTVKGPSLSTDRKDVRGFALFVLRDSSSTDARIGKLLKDLVAVMSKSRPVRALRRQPLPLVAFAVMLLLLSALPPCQPYTYEQDGMCCFLSYSVQSLRFSVYFSNSVWLLDHAGHYQIIHVWLTLPSSAVQFTL
jgi:hypothetical protein